MNSDKQHTYSGFSLIAIVITVVALGFVGFVGWGWGLITRLDTSPDFVIIKPLSYQILH